MPPSTRTRRRERPPREEAPKSDTITSSTLAAPSPMTLPPRKPLVENDALDGALSANTDAFTRELEQKALAREKAKESSSDDLYKMMRDFGGETSLTDQAYSQDGGVDDLDLELQDINNQMRQETEALRRKVERVETAAGTATSGERDREIGEIRRVSLRKQADLAIIQLSRQGRYDSAKAIADRAVAAQLEQQRQEIDLAQQIYTDNKEAFSEADTRLFNTLQADRQRKFDAQELELKTISDLSIEALKNGAPPSVASMMRQAKTQDEAISIGGQYIGLLDRQQAQASIAAANRSNRGGGGGGSSNVTAQVLDGFTSMDDLTPTQQQKVRDELYEMGFNSSAPPAWFKEFIEDETYTNYTPDGLRSQWDSYKSNVLGGGRSELEDDEIDFE